MNIQHNNTIKSFLIRIIIWIELINKGVGVVTDNSDDMSKMIIWDAEKFTQLGPDVTG